MINKIVVLLVLCTTSFFATAQSKQPPTPVMVSHINFLNELSHRRQVNTFFPNSQATNELQKHFVNVSKGNLTFIRRDLVTHGRLPVNMARVYDSTIQSSDFGMGWQLSLAETIEVLDDGSLSYQDDTATLNTFVPAAVGFNISPAQNSDIKSVMFNGAGQLQITYLSGWVKQFEKHGEKHRLASITDNNKNRLTLNYHEGQLAAVIGANGRRIDIKRNGQGRIASIEDNNGRIVKYHYSQKGLLEAVDDLGGNQWQYQYHGNGLLHKVLDPEGQFAAKFSFGSDKKATSVKVRARKYRYSYKGNKTEVTDEKGDTTTFVQNGQDITTTVTDASGFTSRIVLNERNQITKLFHNDKLQAKIVYDDNGRPYRYDINGKPTQMERDILQQNYQYDDAGRLLSVGNTAFVYDARGNLIQHKTDKLVRTYKYAANGDVLGESQSNFGFAPSTSNYSYNNDGQLTTIKTNGQTSKFEYNPIGKLSKVTFADGANHSYQYDKLGFRKHIKRSDKSSVDYVYDKVGNLTESKKAVEGINSSKTNKQKLNASNQVVKISHDGQTPLAIKYTTKGNPKAITQDDKTFEYQYDAFGRLIGVTDHEKGQLNYTYQKDEPDIRLQLDDRTKGAKSQQTQVTGHNQTQTQLHYARVSGSPWQSVVWNEALNRLLVPSLDQITAPDDGYQSAKQRRRLRDAKSTIKHQQRAYDKPSNAQFRPAEYSFSNCTSDAGGPGDLNDSGGSGSDCYLYGVILDAASTITAGSPYTFSAYSVADDKCTTTNYSFSIDNVAMGQNTSGYFPYTFTQPGAHSVQVSAECSCGGTFKLDGMNVNVEQAAPSSVSLGIYSQPTLTLLDTYTLTTTVQPSSLTVSNYKIEIKKHDATTWEELYSGNSRTFSSYAKVAGYFKLRTTVTIDKKEYQSNELDIEVRFPDFYQIIGDSHVESTIRQGWQQILDDTSPTRRRERGFWVQLNTATKQYEIIHILPSAEDWTDNEHAASISLWPIPIESSANPSPLQGVTYNVATFHGHTPRTYIDRPRDVGPSTADDTNNKINFLVVGIVYDYIAAPITGDSIPAYHPLNSPVKAYLTDRSRRSTPL